MRRHDDYEAKSCPKAVTPRKLSLEKLFACGCCSSKRDSSSSATRSRSSAAGAAAERAAAARGRTYKSEEADAAEAGLEDVGRRRRCRRLGKQEAEKELKILNQKIARLLNRVESVPAVEAKSGEAECAVCISSGATVQTFPCRHRATCQRCFVKTIQTAVEQKQLPLTCVLCRGRITSLRKTEVMKGEQTLLPVRQQQRESQPLTRLESPSSLPGGGGGGSRSRAKVPNSAGAKTPKRWICHPPKCDRCERRERKLSDEEAEKDDY